MWQGLEIRRQNAGVAFLLLRRGVTYRVALKRPVGGPSARKVTSVEALNSVFDEHPDYHGSPYL